MHTPQGPSGTPEKGTQSSATARAGIDSPILRLYPATDSEPELSSVAGMRELSSLLLSTDFRQNFVDSHLAPSLRAKEILERRIHDKLVFPIRMKAANERLFQPDKKQAKKLAKEITQFKLQEREFDITRPLDLITLRHTLLNENAHYRNLYDAALQRVESERNRAHRIADELIEDLTSLQDPSALLSALELWGRSRDATGDRNDGYGYHAGVVHYFEYRTVPDKNKRFIGNEYAECRLQNFIDISESFRPFLRNAPEEAAQQAHSYISINDNSDQRRVFIRTEKVLLIAFQKIEQPLRLLSFIPNKPGWEEREDTVRRIKRELAAEGIDTRFNRLGLDRSLESHKPH